MPTVKELLDRFRGRGGLTSPSEHEVSQNRLSNNERARRASARLRIEHYNMSVAAIHALHGIPHRRSLCSNDPVEAPSDRPKKRRSIVLDPLSLQIDSTHIPRKASCHREYPSSPEELETSNYSFSSSSSGYTSDTTNFSSSENSSNPSALAQTRERSNTLDESKSSIDSLESSLNLEEQDAAENSSSPPFLVRSTNTDGLVAHLNHTREDQVTPLFEPTSDAVQTPSPFEHRSNNSFESIIPTSSNMNSDTETSTEYNEFDDSSQFDSSTDSSSNPTDSSSLNDSQSESSESGSPMDSVMMIPDSIDENEEITTNQASDLFDLVMLNNSRRNIQLNDRIRGQTLISASALSVSTNASFDSRNGSSKRKSSSKRIRMPNKNLPSPPSTPRELTHLQAKEEYIMELYNLISTSNDPAVLYTATKLTRRMISHKNHPPIAQVVNVGFIPYFVKFLEFEDQPNLQFQAVWALLNVAAGTTEQTQKVIESGAVPPIVSLVSSPYFDIREQAVWAIGNISGDSPEIRDFVIEQNAIQAIVSITKRRKPSLSMQGNIAWCCLNFCQGSPPPSLESVAPMLPILKKFIKHNKCKGQGQDVLVDSCWALAYMANTDIDRIQAVLSSGACTYVINKLLYFQESAILKPALKLIGYICNGLEEHTQEMVNLGLLPAILELLERQPSSKVISQTCWVISNIVATNADLVQSVIDCGIIPLVIDFAMDTDHLYVAKEATWTLANTASTGSIKHREILVEAGIIRILLGALEQGAWRGHDQFIIVLLDAIKCILLAGNNIDRTPGESQFAEQMRAIGLFDLIKSAFVTSDVNEIKEKSVFIVEQYFDDATNHSLKPKAQPEGSTNTEQRTGPLLPVRVIRRISQRLSGPRKPPVPESPYNPTEAPPQFHCPISQELMIDPVLTLDGHCYDRYNIQRWFNEGNNTSPVTGKELRSLTVVPNHSLRQMIERFKPGYTHLADAVTWTCTTCTCVNQPDMVVCTVCMGARPHPRPEVVVEVQGIDEF